MDHLEIKGNFDRGLIVVDMVIQRSFHCNKLCPAYPTLEASVMNGVNAGNPQSLHIIGINIAFAYIIEKNREHQIVDRQHIWDR